MSNHTKIYKEYFDIGEQDLKWCEWCRHRLIDHVHHIEFKQMGGKKTNIDRIENLIGLCSICHDEAHGKGGYISKEQLENIVAKRN